MSIFAENLKKCRTEKGISQSELANKIDIHVTHLSRYERGLSLPSIEVAQKIADVLEISLDELVNGGEDLKIQKTIKDRELLNLFNKVQILSEKQKETVKDFLSSYILTNELKQKLA